MTVTAFEFIRRFLQHVLPTGFRKVRYYGFMTQRRQDEFELVRWKVTLAQGEIYELTSHPEPPKKSRAAHCPTCGQALRLISVVRIRQRETSPPSRPPPLDSS